MPMNTDFDAIVVGSGISGGWAAKELSEKTNPKSAMNGMRFFQRPALS